MSDKSTTRRLSSSRKVEANPEEEVFTDAHSLVPNETAGQQSLVEELKEVDAPQDLPFLVPGAKPQSKPLLDPLVDNAQRNRPRAPPSPVTPQLSTNSDTLSEFGSLPQEEDSNIISFKTNTPLQHLRQVTKEQLAAQYDVLAIMLSTDPQSSNLAKHIQRVAELHTLLDMTKPPDIVPTVQPQSQVQVQERVNTIKDFPKDLPKYQKGINPKVFLKAITSHCRLYSVVQTHWLNHLAAAMPYDEREWCTTDFLGDTKTTWTDGTKRWAAQYTREGDLDLAKTHLESLREGHDLAAFLREFELWWPSANPDGDIDGETARADVLRKLDKSTPYYGHIKDATKQGDAPSTYLTLRALCLSKQESY
jgi:hypothetical protein